MDGERRCPPSPFRNWGSAGCAAGWRPSGTENDLSQGQLPSPTSYPTLLAWQPQLNDKRVQGPSPLSPVRDSSEGWPYLQNSPWVVWVNPSTPVPSTSWSQVCTQINILYPKRHLSHISWGNWPGKQSSLLFLPMPQVRFASGIFSLLCLLLIRLFSQIFT